MRARLGLAAIVTFAIVLAWWMRWGCDDAFISFNYARSLLRGDGLTWFGEPIEGYTNFLWVMWSAGGLALGVDPLAWAWGGSLAAQMIALVATYRLGRVRTTSTVAALCAVAMLATNFTFIAFGTSGLETMLQTALLALATLEVEQMRRGAQISTRRIARLSVIAALALMTRLDSAVVLAVLGIALLHHLVRTRAPSVLYVAASVPALVLVGAWLGWKLAYYGELLPNAFHAKVDLSSSSMTAAASYVKDFAAAYGLWSVLAVVVVVAVARRAFAARLPATLVGVWVGYVILVGGDFMEFRFFVPIMPVLFVMIAEALIAGRVWRSIGSPLVATALVVVLAAFSWRHAAKFEGAADHHFDSVIRLATYYGKITDNDWSKLGSQLRDVLAGSSATLACNGAGAIPYYADLPTVDQLGLNDRWVARHGARPPADYARPGHQRFATQDYLVEREVTLVIGSPALIPRGALMSDDASDVIRWAEQLLGPAPISTPSLYVVAAPVSEHDALLLWYLTPIPEITARMTAAGWELREFRRR